MSDTEKVSSEPSENMENGMTTLQAIPEAEEPWESGKLGRDCDHAERAPESLKAEVEAALGLQMISIRLQKQLITEMKFIAEYRGIGYQPLMRDVLARFARAEMSQIAYELQEQQKARQTIEADTAAKRKRA